MENQTHAQNQRVPVIQVSGLKKQYKLGQIGGGTLTHDLQSWWARVRGKEDPNTVIGTDARLFGKTFMALNGVDLTVYKGEALGIIGRNGAGKSTLLKILSRITAPTEGEIRLRGRVASMLEVGTPMMVQMLIMSMVIFANSRNFTMVGALALGINSGAYVSEIIRGGLMAVDPGQMEAGRSLGLNYMTTMVLIVIPQAIRSVLPALGNEFIVLLKDTSLITVIGGKELLYAAQGIMNRTYEPMFPLFGVALMYLILVMIFTWLLGKLEGRLAKSDRR